ncbi:hypothetical protein CW751_00565 [Brumimicrobium salinarum]|uniref:Uncharacterized protein n=1 Tax=Brumimicrobium salinarum TaxID=2058658 RepID=A0A2I0R5K2_9FLAO|nr:hypothetical protein [Brumimicrobium salinarum]PKR81864.1 hypothetical protein CW751_00565 [Brumimicrobium salinarum]
MKVTLFLTLLLITLSCKKDESVKSYLSEPPVLKGFYLRDANGLLMQKVEELTLYLIEQDEKSDELKMEIELLRKEISELK